MGIENTPKKSSFKEGEEGAGAQGSFASRTIADEVATRGWRCKKIINGKECKRWNPTSSNICWECERIT